MQHIPFLFSRLQFFFVRPIHCGWVEYLQSPNIIRLPQTYLQFLPHLCLQLLNLQLVLYLDVKLYIQWSGGRVIYKTTCCSHINKWKSPFSNTVGWLRARFQICILKSVSLCLRLYRTKWRGRWIKQCWYSTYRDVVNSRLWWWMHMGWKWMLFFHT